MPYGQKFARPTLPPISKVNVTVHFANLLPRKKEVKLEFSRPFKRAKIQIPLF